MGRRGGNAGNLIHQPAHGLLDDVIHDIARGVIHAARLPHFGLFLDGEAPALRAHDLAEEALIDTAEDFDGDDVEEVGRLVVAQFADEPGEPFVADDEGLAEVRLEQVAVEKWDGGGRAAVEGAEVADDGVPEGIRRSRGDETLISFLV